MRYQKPKGTQDILPGVSNRWQFIEETARLLFSDYQFHEIRTPMFEHYEVISRSVGDTTDIVSKEMYDFFDKGDRHITLRPEGTAPVVRSFVENKLFGNDFTKPFKTYYCGPMFRYERPQAGRMRQFHQIGVEVFGSANPATDVETICLALEYFKQLGISHLKLVINSLGDSESRKNYRQALIEYLQKYASELSKDSQTRLEVNPLRVLDSKDPLDQKIVANAPSILDYLSEQSQKHFDEVKKMFEAIDVSYEVDATMVRGLDYYNDTIFEIISEAPGFGGVATTVCGGGRYDNLVEELGGPSTPGFGFAIGLERLLITLEAENIELPIEAGIDVYVVGMGEATNIECLKLVQAVRGAGYSAERDYLNRKPKAQFKTANKLGAKLVMTIGESELADEQVTVKNMESGVQEKVSFAEVYDDFDNVYDKFVEIKA